MKTPTKPRDRRELVRKLKDQPGVRSATKSWTLEKAAKSPVTEEEIPTGTRVWMKVFLIPVRLDRGIPRFRRETTLDWAERQSAIRRETEPMYLPLEMRTMTWEGRKGWTPLMVSLPGQSPTEFLEYLLTKGSELMAPTQAKRTRPIPRQMQRL